jgi:hypothetical protein
MRSRTVAGWIRPDICTSWPPKKVSPATEKVISAFGSSPADTELRARAHALRVATAIRIPLPIGLPMDVPFVVSKKPRLPNIPAHPGGAIPNSADIPRTRGMALIPTEK